MDFIAKTAREPVLVSFVGGARRSVVDDERGLEMERTVPLFSGSGIESRVESSRELERFRRLKGFKGSKLYQPQIQYDIAKPKLI